MTDLELVQIGSVVRCAEQREDGKVVGELEVQVFSAALVIDRDGILESKVMDALGVPAVHVTLPGASGYRAMRVEKTSPLPYRYVFAMAPSLGVDAGVLVTIRSAKPDWPAGDAMLRSLRILTRNGVAPANDEVDGMLLPMPLG